MQVPSTSLSKSNPLSDLAFDELLALADAAWVHSNAFLPGNDEGKMDQYPSILTSTSYCMDYALTNPTNKLLSHHHLSSLEQHSIINEHDNPQGTSCTTCCSITTSQVAPPIPDNGIRAERRPAEAMQMNMKEKCQGKKMINASAIRIDNNGTPLSKEAQPKRTEKPVSPKPAQSNNDQTKKMMPESAKSCCNSSLNFDKGASDEGSADKENATVHPGIEIGVVAPEINAGIACELNSSIEQASNYTSFPNDKQAPGTSSKSNLHREKPKVIPAAKRKCVRRKGLNKNSTPPTEMTEEFTEEFPEYAKMSLNPDIGARDECSAGRENGIIVQETNLGLAYDLNASVKHASNSFMSLPGGTQAPDISSQRTLPGTKPKENPTGKRKYVRRKELKKTYAPPTEVTGEMTTEKMPKFAKLPCKSSMNFDKGEIGESSAVKENATVHLSKEIVVTQEMNPDLAYDVNSCMSLTEDTQATNTSLRRNPHGAKTKESPTAEMKYVRRSALNKSSTATEVLGDLTGEMMPESAKTSCRRSLNFDKEARDESSADRENATVHLCKEIGLVMHEMDVGFAYDINTSVKRAAANNYMSFPNEQTPSTSPSKNNPSGAKPKENLAGKQEFKEMSRRRSSNSDIGIKDESFACREVSDVQIANVVGETPVSLAYNQDTWMEQALNSYRSLPEDSQSPSTYSSKSNLPGAKPKESPTGKRKYVRKKKLNSTATSTEMTGELTEPIMSDSSTIISCGMSLNFDKGGRDESNTCRESLACDQNTLAKEALYNYMSLSENTHARSTSLPQSNHPGAKLNANPVENKNKRKGLATDGNISNSQISTTGLQMVGYKRKHSGTIKCAYNSSMNLIGAHYNGLPSYESKFRIQFPNIQKKRRTEMRKTSNTHITSSVISKKEVPLTCTQEVAQAHPYASNSNCLMYGGSAYNSIIHNAPTFDEFILTLRRLSESSQPPAQTYDCNSLTRIRNSDIEANYNVKQLGISDWQTFGDADRPQTCIDFLAKEMHVSCAKKKRSRKRRALSSSARPNTNETQQHHNFAWGNHHLPLGKSSDIAHQVIWKSMHNVEALAEQFRQLNINTEARDIVLNVQNALVPFQGSFDPIKKQHPPPKVYLDEETDRVWKLLMLDINHHGIDGTDEDKAKWWEEKRNVFRGRADSFIARMHLVQGDRRFSRWKGSVLDSVVGVFLTQKVSGHLSSSAFMSLAARFPKKSSSMCQTYHGEGTSLVVNKQVHIVEPEENTEWDVKLLDQPVYDQSSMAVDLVEHSGEKAVNSDDSCIITTSVISLTDESNSRLSESPQRNIKEHQCPMVMIEEGEEKSCHDGARRELNGINSSQCSVLSSQLSGDFSNDQNPEKIGSCSDSNSEVEDLYSTAKYNSCTSFSKLLEMVSSTKFHEVNSQRSKPAENLRDAYGESIGMKHDNATESMTKSNVTQGTLDESIIPSSGFLKNKDESDMNRPSFQTAESGLNQSPTPREVSGDLTAEMMPESAKTCCRRSLNFDTGAREESSADTENATVYLCKEIGLVMQEMDVGLAYDMNTSMRQAAANNYMSFPNEQTPSTSPSKNNLPGAKLNANSVENKNERKGLATAQDGNISNSQNSTIGLQMVGYKRKDNGTIKCAYNSSMNLIGARNHVLPSYESKFRIQFPNIQKKRRTEMRKTFNTHSTSSVTSKKEVPLTCTQEVAQAHPYASNSNCWLYGGSAYNSIIHNAPTFDEFILTLRRLTESSQPPAQTYDCNSPMRVRNSDVEPNYTAKNRSARKKRNRKRSALSGSAHSNINEMQQHHNVALGNHHLPLGKSSDIAHEVIWKSTHNVEALGERVRQLNINTEVRACLT